MIHVTPDHPKVSVTPDGCWVWTGANNVRYGRKRDPDLKRDVYLHRANYEYFVGPIPDGLHIDHLCRVTLCCNPDHLEAVTHKVNALRGVSPAAQQARQTHCKNGHPFAGGNLHITPLGKRHCRECGRIYMAEYYAKNGRKDWRKSGRYAVEGQSSLA